MAMPIGFRFKKYLVVSREDHTNQVKGKVVRLKTTSIVSQFSLEEIVCRYVCIGKIVANRRELKSNNALELHEEIELWFLLITSYNLEANGKIERCYGPIIKALTKAY